MKNKKKIEINPKNIEIYEKYLRSCYIKSRDTIDTTYKVYKSNMHQFLEYLRDLENNRYIISDSTIKNFYDIWERYANECIQKGNNNRTINNKRTAISTFYDWCEKRDIIKYNPFRKIDTLKITSNDLRRESYFLTQKQIWEINYHMEKDTKNFDIQDRILFNLFLDSAGRISAIHSLKISQLKIEENIFENVREKEGYIVSIIFFNETKELIKKWFEIRKEKNIESDFLFLTYYKDEYKQMTKETIRNRVKKMGKIIGIKSFYPHSIRKTIINIISSIGNISDGAILANHKDSKVTSEYYIKHQKQNDIKNRLIDLRIKAGL
ncbi:tyrosine-type recombinase/integrase [Fusobacterium perfoetens]|uniref:tyrosine-type recombinase/integrase n=1 Tax=Fusobacterium perfoetens TaxID=852 RepID=UPI0026F3158E|nr:tyrosine-type recombinase/integrase [Fusobacterium perfoetens]